jgi:hypothetical protein
MTQKRKNYNTYKTEFLCMVPGKIPLLTGQQHPKAGQFPDGKEKYMIRE